MPPNPSICFFSTSPSLPQALMGDGPLQVGGAEIRSALLARSLAQRGWPVSFAVYDYGQADEMHTPEGIRVIRASGKRSGLDLLKLFRDILPADHRAFRSADADIYIEMGIGWRAGLLPRWCHKEGRKFILWLASITDPLAADPKRSRIPKYSRWLARRGLKEAHLVIAQTEEQAQLMRELYRRECPVIPNVWVVTPAQGLKTDPPEAFWAARYLPLKRPEMVLEAARRLPHLRFVMAGGPVRGHEALYEEIQEAAAGVPNLQALGFVPFSEIDQYYARARAYLCTSTIEGFPNTFLQAWNHKTPVVSTYDPDGVINKHGLGVGCRDIDEVVAGLERVCGPEGVVVGERCREYLERVHSVEAVMGALEPLLLGLAG